MLYYPSTALFWSDPIKESSIAPLFLSSFSQNYTYFIQEYTHTNPIIWSIKLDLNFSY